MAEVEVHLEAEYEHALAWYLERSPRATGRFVAAFDAAIEALRTNPRTFPPCDALHRFILVDRYPYRLIYRSDGDCEVVRVIAVAHASRRPGYWSRRT